jgi:prevent-host-death family protein
MATISMRELRNHGGDIIQRVGRGEALTVTNDGAQVAELRPLPKRSLSTAELVARRRALPFVDPDALRADIDDLIDPSL